MEALLNMIKSNKNLVKSFVLAINKSDWESLSHIVAQNFVRHSYAAGEPGVKSCQDLIKFLQSELQTFPDGREELLDIVAEGNKVAARHRFSGTQSGPLGSFPPTGKKMVVEYIAIYRIENGCIVEAWVEWDNKSGLTQLGHE